MQLGFKIFLSQVLDSIKVLPSYYEILLQSETTMFGF